MKPYPVTLKYSSTFELIPWWVPEVLQTWLEEGWACDLTVSRKNHRVQVTITASTSEDLAAKREAFNKMIEAKGYGPEANKK
ncbi:MAG: hypothetical protein NC548_41075 [Lachnospiraceae bacterium]|nr:hypothetical protein [Lachnospiraceae bacterium]